MEKFKKAFRRLPDPRADNALHELLEVLFIALAATLCGAEGPSDMAMFGHSKEGLLRLVPAVAARGAQPRYFQPGLPPAGPAGVRGRIPPVHGRLRQGQRTGTARCGGGRWQSLARCLRAWPAKHPAAHGQCLGSGGANVLGPAQSSRPQRGSRGVGSPGPAGPRRLYRYRGCTALPSRLCHHGARAGCGLRAGAQGEPEQVVRCGRSALCAQRSPQRCRTARTRHSRSLRVRGARPSCAIPLSPRSRSFPASLRWPASPRAAACSVPARSLPRCATSCSPNIFPPSNCCASCAPIGGSRTSCIGYSMSSSTRIATELAKTTRPRTSLSSESSPSIWSAATPRPHLLRQKIKRAGWDDAFLLGMLGHMR